MRPHRKERIASVVREIVSDAIARRLNDPRVAPLTTVSRVTVTGDLSVATVYLTVVGDAAAETRTLAALQHAAGFVQRMVAHEVRIRQCPELRFEIDEAAKRVRETMRLLEENRRREPQLYPTAEPAATAEEPSESAADDVEVPSMPDDRTPDRPTGGKP